ncbi:MAG TPA: CHASE3 domain-containing protein [Gemmataceae bacterium]|nr:CHASE3 domain-containing protein [Gemmataceae bacterium]
MRNAVTVGFGLVLAVLLVSAAVLLRNLLVVINHDAAVAHSYQVVAGTEAVRSSMLDAETGARGFLLTGKKEFLDPYDSAVAGIHGRIEHLRALTVDNPTQQASIRELTERVDKQLALLAEKVRTRREQKTWSGDAQDIDRLVRGKAQMDGIRDTLDHMRQEEDRLLALRDDQARSSALTAILSLAAVTVLSIAFLTATFILVQRDRRQREHAADLVRQEREWLRVVLKGIGDGVVATDAQGHVTLLNPVAEKLTGWSEAEAVGRSVVEVFHIVNEHTRQPVANPAERCLREGVVVGLANHTVLISRDGTERPIDDSGGPIRSDDRIVGAVLVFRDITERRQAEVERQESERRRERFLAVLSHELRHPLAPLSNAVEILGMKGDDPSVVADVRDMMGRQIQQLTRLIEELLDASRVVQGKVQLRRERLDLAAQVRSTAEDHRAQAEEAGLTLTLDVPAGPVWMSGDAVRLSQIVGNLLHNATKFTDRGGRVTVRLSAADGEAVLTVEDTGMGIAAEAMPRLFEAFSQADAGARRDGGGLGLGLAVVKGMAELHGGRVRAQSAGPGRGATFTVWLPLERGSDSTVQNNGA